MYHTGLDLNEKYRETAHGGLAQIYQENLKNQEGGQTPLQNY
jgi:hypothetical protein